MTEEHLCVICSKRHYERAMVCNPCRDRLPRTLADIVDLHAQLPAALERDQANAQRVTGSREAPVPVNIDAVDLSAAARIATGLRAISGWRAPILDHLLRRTNKHPVRRPDQIGPDMTQHRVPCPAEPPELMQPNGPIAGALGNHQHACIHDAEPDNPQIRAVEHKCECGMTWTERRERTEEQP